LQQVIQRRVTAFLNADLTFRINQVHLIQNPPDTNALVSRFIVMDIQCSTGSETDEENEFFKSHGHLHGI